jgi:hypothetical protein
LAAAKATEITSVIAPAAAGFVAALESVAVSTRDTRGKAAEAEMTRVVTIGAAFTTAWFVAA